MPGHQRMSPTALSLEAIRFGLFDTVRCAPFALRLHGVSGHKRMFSTVASLKIVRCGLCDTVRCAPLASGYMVWMVVNVCAVIRF